VRFGLEGDRRGVQQLEVGSLPAVSRDSLWEQHSRWWQGRFTDGGDPEYEEQILPLVGKHLRAARRVLDVGCGEGQVSRYIARGGGHVVGLDPTPSQIREARTRGGPPQFVEAKAEQLPFGDDTFDAVILCLAIEHIDPFEPAIDEIARVLEPDGQFLLLLVHPLLQAPGSGWVDEGEAYWRVGSYLPDDFVIDEVEPGVYLPFNHRPLSRYVHAMGAAGLLVEDMVEPSPPPAVLVETGGFVDAAAIPRLMVLSARCVR
jgi:SAM-dependent methyltransferase